jgi:glucose/arabinose dehydrogenase
MFQNETLVGGLDQPTTLQFLPDGRMLVLERGGDIELVSAGGTQVQPTPFLRLTNINTEGDRGLVGITLDPSFATNGWYYVYYSANSPLRERVSRFTASGNSTVAGSEVMIWQDNRTSESEHHGGTIAFGPDGMLYISAGDHFIASDAQLLTNFMPGGRIGARDERGSR